MAGLVFLRVLPLLTTSSYLTFTIAEDLYFKPYLEASVVNAANSLLPYYISVWYTRGMILIFTIYPLTWCTAVANLPVANLHSNVAAFVLYLLGLLFSIGHMLWGPHAMNLLNSIKVQDTSTGSTEIVKRWCRMNLIRGALVDVPAWGCFLAGFLVWESTR